MFFLKKKKFVSVDKRIKMKLRKYFKVGLLHMNDHPHTRKLFVTTKNDRTMKKNHTHLMMFHWQKNCPMQKGKGL